MFHGRETFFAAAHAQQGVAVILVGNSVVRVKGNRGFEFAFDTFPVPVVVGERRKQYDMCFGKGIVQRQGLQRGSFCARIGFRRRNELVEALKIVAIGKSSIGARIIRIDKDGFMQQINRFFQRISRARGGKEFGLHIFAVGLRLLRIGTGESF